jgi:hypothetical protein
MDEDFESAEAPKKYANLIEKMKRPFRPFKARSPILSRFPRVQHLISLDITFSHQYNSVNRGETSDRRLLQF